MFMVRKIGFTIPKGIVPFVSGVHTTTLMLLYCSVYEPIDFGLIPRALFSSKELPADDSKALLAIFYGFLAGIFGWLAIDFMTIGVRISKSAISSYAEQTGIVLPFLFDIFFFGRQMLLTDALGLTLIVILQSYQAYLSMQEAGKEESGGGGGKKSGGDDDGFEKMEEDGGAEAMGEGMEGVEMEEM